MTASAPAKNSGKHLATCSKRMGAVEVPVLGARPFGVVRWRQEVQLTASTLAAVNPLPLRQGIYSVAFEVASGGCFFPGFSSPRAVSTTAAPAARTAALAAFLATLFSFELCGATAVLVFFAVLVFLAVLVFFAV